MDNPQGASYPWIIGGTATPLSSLTASSILVSFPAIGPATISLTARNACGDAVLAPGESLSFEVLDECKPPRIAGQSSTSVSIAAGNSTPLSVSADGGRGAASLQYQWYSNTTASITDGNPIDGATSASYTVTTTTSTTVKDYYYYCVVSTTCGSEKVSSNVFTVKVTSYCSGALGTDGYCYTITTTKSISAAKSSTVCPAGFNKIRLAGYMSAIQSKGEWYKKYPDVSIWYDLVESGDVAYDWCKLSSANAWATGSSNIQAYCLCQRK
jgi:hypothetical protein